MKVGQLTVRVEVDGAAVALVQTAAEAMDAAGLHDALEDLADRLVSSGRIVHVEVEATAAGAVARSTLRPFAELVLREAVAAASDRRLDRATAAAHLERVLSLGGF